MKKLGHYLLKGVHKNRRSDLKKRKKSPLLKSRTIAKKKNTRQRATLGPIVSSSRQLTNDVIVTSSSEALRLYDLIYPQGKIKSALEGFFLNQHSEHSRIAYAKDYKKFISYLENHLGSQLDRSFDRTVAVGYKEYLIREKLSLSTVDRHLSSLKSLCRWFEEEDLITKSPFKGVRFTQGRKISGTIGFSDTEVKAMLSAPSSHTKTGIQHRAILTLLFYLGLRRSELVALRTTQFFKHQNIWAIRLKGKGQSERIIAVPEGVYQVIEHYAKAFHFKINNEDRVLFTALKNNRSSKSVDGKPKEMDPSTIFYIVRKYAKLVGIQSKVSPHSCRATAISNARDKKASDRVIQEFAGWSTPNMITHYDKRKNAIENSASLSIRYGEKLEEKESQSSLSVEEEETL